PDLAWLRHRSFDGVAPVLVDRSRCAGLARGRRPLELHHERRQPDIPLRSFPLCLAGNSSSSLHRRNGRARLEDEKGLNLPHLRALLNFKKARSCSSWACQKRTSWENTRSV